MIIPLLLLLRCISMNLTGYNGGQARWLSLCLEEEGALRSAKEEEGKNERSPALEAGARLIYRPRVTTVRNTCDGNDKVSPSWGPTRLSPYPLVAP